MARIAVFDSGLGGLSILHALREALPTGVAWHYCADSAAFPYGRLSADDLEARVRAVIAALIAESRPDVLVIACNTASTGALAAVRRDHPDLSVVGVVPAIKPAAALSRSKVIGLLATPGTVASPYTDQLIADHATDCRVIRHGAVGLVRLAEGTLRGQIPSHDELAEEIAPLFTDPEMDAVVLGCTHFPLVAEALARVAPRPVHWIDSGEAVARQTVRILPTSALNRAEDDHRAFITAPSEGLAEALTGARLENIQTLLINQPNL